MDLGNLDGQRAIVTGANTGLGYESAVALAAAGAQVVLAVRDRARGEAAIERIRRTWSQAKVSLGLLDLADLASIAEFAQTQLSFGRLDILINNAGLMLVPDRRLTVDGFELQMGVNHLGHFALTAQLWPALELAPRSRVVSVSSMARLFTGRLDLGLGETGRYSPMGNYAQSKLACLMFALELDRRAKAAASRVESVAAHPGYAATELLRPHRKPGFGDRLSAWATPIFAAEAGLGAQSQLRAATDSSLQGGEFVGPRYLMRGAAVIQKPGRAAQDRARAAALWRLSEARTGVRFAL